MTKFNFEIDGVLFEVELKPYKMFNLSIEYRNERGIPVHSFYEGRFELSKKFLKKMLLEFGSRSDVVEFVFKICQKLFDTKKEAYCSLLNDRVYG